MTTAWAHLPNAHHIDAVLKHTQESAAWDAVWGATRDALIALVAFDDCGHLMSAPIEVVAVATKLGIPAAVLLYPIRLAMETYEPSPPTQTAPDGSSPHC